MNHQQNKPWEVTRCQNKRAFASKADAEKSGQRGYRCPVCHYWHRTGGVRKLFNPVLRILLISLIISQILDAQAEVVVDEKPGVVKDAIIGHMLKRGYELYTQSTSAIYLLYQWRGNKQGECYTQEWKFTLKDLGGKTAVSGYALCYTDKGAVPFESDFIDTIIVDAMRDKRGTEFK